MCRVDGCAGWTNVLGGRMRMVDGCAGWTDVQGGRMCRVDECAGWTDENGGWTCKVIALGVFVVASTNKHSLSPALLIYLSTYCIYAIHKNKKGFI